MTDLQVKYFLKVADCMSFSQAARELYVSQPSVSRQVMQLEKEVGYPLFDRSKKNTISLTAAGMVFRDSFRRFQNGYERALAAAREVSGQEELHLRVGFGEGWDLTGPLTAFRDRVGVQHPNATVQIFSYPFLTLRNMLRADQLDVILCTKTCVQSFEDLEIVPIADLESHAYILRGVACPEDQDPKVSDLEGRELLYLPEEEAPMNRQIIQLQLLAHRVTTTARCLPNRDSIRQAVLMGEGFGVFDQLMTMGRDPRLTSVRLDDCIPICVVWNRNNQNPLIRLFAETISNAFTGAG